MKEIPVDEAVGLVLGHDLTQVIPGEFKGVRFRRGHKVSPEDIPVLKSMGKEHLFVLEVPEGLVHEEEAAQTVSEAVVGQGVALREPREGKVNLEAAWDGLLVLDKEAITAVNRRGDMAIVTLPDRYPVRKGDKVASVKSVPLLVPEEKVEAARSHPGIIQVKPFRPLRVWLLTTGQEVYSGKVTDAFKPKIEAKLAPFGIPLLGQSILPDDRDEIAGAVRERIDSGEVDLLLVTGGMSVDPDDRTPAAVRHAGVEILSQGAPVLPGSMFLVGRSRDVAVLGLPACVIFDPVTIFDLVLPRVLAGEVPSFLDLAELGVGGLLTSCSCGRSSGGVAWDL